MRHTAICTVFAIGLCMAMAHGDEPKPDTATDKSFWMTKKLQYMQDILAGLTSEDLELVAKKASQMRALSKIEGWARRAESEEYRRQLRLFQRTTQMLEGEAAKSNLDGATLAFTQVTVSCVNCHNHLRADASP